MSARLFARLVPKKGPSRSSGAEANPLLTLQVSQLASAGKTFVSSVDFMQHDLESIASRALEMGKPAANFWVIRRANKTPSF